MIVFVQQFIGLESKDTVEGIPEMKKSLSINHCNSKYWEHTVITINLNTQQKAEKGDNK
jgi:hypothetical protein